MRFRRIRTAISSHLLYKVPASAERKGKSPSSPLFLAAFSLRRKLLHHFFHVLKLFDQPVHFLDGSAASPGDPATAAGVEDFRMLLLLGRHRPDDRLHPAQLLLIRSEEHT